jgi:alpha-L-rhamnosidase
MDKKRKRSSQITRLFSCLAAVVTIVVPVVRADVVAQASTCQPERLRCEYLIEPLGLDVPHPRLDWILTGTSETPRNLSQSSYRILVASSPDVLAHDKGDLWDSGEVKSDATSQIAYAGAELKSRETCYWKVRVTDSLGGVSAWSKPAMWEMGLLSPGDWQAKWISAPMIAQAQADPGASAPTLLIDQASYEATDGGGARDVTDLVKGMVKDNSLSVRAGNDTMGGDSAPGHPKQLRVTYTLNGKKHEASAGEGNMLSAPVISMPYLRKDFALAKPIAKARVYATALGLYELRLNGQRVGDHVFAPDWTAYDKRVRYQVYDVTSMVNQGDNTLAGMVGSGWYCGHVGWFGIQKYGKIPALLTQLEVTYADGSTETIVTDASWKLHAGPIIASDLQIGEDYDTRLEIAGWDQPGLDVGNWVAATERPESCLLEEQVDQPVRETGEIHPKAMTEPKPGHWVFDLGQNMAGVVRIKVSAPAGTKIILRHAEMINPNGTLNAASLGGAPSIDTYICKGEGVETWQPRFTCHGFRYVELSGLQEAPGDDAVTGIVIGTDIPRTGEFSCSNADINQLQSNIQWSMRSNYLSIPTDCPQRAERLGWMGDAQIFARTAAYNGDVATFFTKWMVEVNDTQAQIGGSAFSDVSPDPTTKSGGGTPAWGDAGVICPWTIYLMYGDKRILQQNLPNMMRWIDWCKVASMNLIRDRGRGGDYGDFNSQGEDTSKELIGTAFFAYSTSLVAKACEVTGDAAGAAKYKQLSEQIKTAFNQHYVSADGHVQGDTQSGYCMALRFNLLPDNLRPLAGQYLADDVKAHQDHLATGFIGTAYLLPALCSQNKVDTAYRVLLQDTLPSWLFEVKHGATTVWEHWDGWTPEKGIQSGSYNHYSLGACGEWMFDSGAGIGVDADQPGFKHIIIRPRPGGDFTHAEGSFDSIHGKISTNWTLDNGQFSLHVVIPVNTTATVYLPAANPSSVQEGGHVVSTLPEIKVLPAGQDGAQFLLGSGDYTFTCQVP